MHEIEHVVINPAEHDYPFENDAKVTCGCDWHVDGGNRGYRLWVPLQKPPPANQTNIAVAPMNYAQQLCKLAGRLATQSEGAETAEMDTASREPVWQMQTDSVGTRGWVREAPDDLTARRRDRDALEAVGCTTAMSPGDLLLFFPGIFHRTQDAKNYRISMIADAA